MSSDCSTSSKALFSSSQDSEQDGMVEILTRENESLRAQFDHLVKISNDIDSVHQKNVQLESKIQALKAENDSLEKRLQVSLDIAQELRDKLAEERKSNESQLQMDRRALQRETLKVKDAAKAQIDSVCQQVQGLQDDKEKAEIDLKQMTSKIEKVLYCASHFFDQDFAQIQELLDFFEQIQKNPTLPAECVAPKKLLELQNKLRKEKTARKTLILTNETLTDKLNRAIREKEEVEKTMKIRLSTVDIEQNKLITEMEAVAAEKDQVIKSLRSQVRTLKSELARQKTENKHLESQLSKAKNPIVRLENPVKSDKDTETTIEDLLERNEELSQQLRIVSDKRDEYLKKVSNLEKKNMELTIHAEKQKHELEAVAIVHHDTSIELERTRAALNKKEKNTKNDSSKLKQSTQMHKELVKSLQSTIEQQKRQINELSVSKEAADHMLESQAVAIESLNQALSENKQTVEQLKEFLSARQQELHSRRNDALVDAIPLSAWTSREFPDELNSLIATVAKNQALQAASKLQMVYKIIKQYFEKIIGSRDMALDQAYSESREIRDAVHQFIVSVSIALEVEPVTFEQFFSTDAPTVMVNKILQIISACDAAERRRQSLESVAAFFDRQLGFKHDGCVDTVLKNINEVKRKLSIQSDTISKQRKKYQAQKSATDVLSTKFEAEKSELFEKISLLNNTVSTLQEQLEEAASENIQLKRKLQCVSDEFFDYKTKNEELLKLAHAEKEHDTLKLKSESEQTLNALSHELAAERKKRELSEKALDNAQSELRKLRKTTEHQTEQISDAAAALSKAEHESERKRLALVDEYNEAKRQTTAKYENILASLRTQCDQHRKDIQKLASELGQYKTAVKNSKLKIFQLKKDKGAAERSIASLQAQLEREKKLAETASKSAILTVETDCAAKLSEQRTQHEVERCKMFAFVADSFRQFYRPQSVIDEGSFRFVVNQVRDRLNELTSSDEDIRRLVNAMEYQSTYDAVAQAIGP